MDIAELAERSGLPPRTVRYYADRGFIRPTRRTEGGYRVFDEAGLRRLRFIRRAQLLGLPLREIVALARAAERQSCGDASRTIVERLREQLGTVERRIAELDAVRHELASLVEVESIRCTDGLCLCNVSTSVPGPSRPSTTPR